MLKDPLFAEGRNGAVNSLIRAAFSVPVFEDQDVIASLACHFTAPHTPSTIEIERNQHFANLIAITFRGGERVPLGKPVFVWPQDQKLPHTMGAAAPG